MTNDFDDLEHHDMEHDMEQAPRSGVRANLVNAWRTQPVVKLFVLIVIAVSVAAVGLTLFNNGPEHKNTSSVTTPPHLNEPPGGAASPYVREQTELANQQREEQALKEKGSSLPTPLGGDTSNKDDALKELKAQIEALTHEVNKPKPAPSPPQQPVVQVQQPEQFDDSLAKAMQKQMGELIGTWRPMSIKQVSVSKDTDGATSQSGIVAGQPAGNAAASATTPPKIPKILIPAGTISYAKLLTQANSDVPGTILAQIVSGPLTGARAIGSFQVTNAYNQYLVLRFNLAEINGKEYQINTVAVDPDTSLAGMVTDVDERYFDRVILPAAASFIQGFSSALSNTGSTVATNGTTTIVSQSSNGIQQGLYSGGSQMANTLSQFLQNQANQTSPLIVVAAGTPMGLLFITSVKDAPPPTAGVGVGTSAPLGLAGYSESTPTSAPTTAPSTPIYPGTTIPGYGGAYPSPTGYGVYTPGAYAGQSGYIPPGSVIGGYPH